MEEIVDFIALDNPQRAISFSIELRLKAQDIATNPYIYPLLRNNNIFRKKSYKGYVILYSIKEDTVEIAHILNSMRDYTKLLK